MQGYSVHEARFLLWSSVCTGLLKKPALSGEGMDVSVRARASRLRDASFFPPQRLPARGVAHIRGGFPISERSGLEVDLPPLNG